MVFSRLPLDKGNQCSMRHMKAVLHDYINELNALQDKTNDDLIPTPEEVAEWALLSFCGIVAANGLDEPLNTDSQEYSMESQIIALLTSETSHNKKIAIAMKRRVQVMLEPPTVDKLSNLNILCLARFISYLDGSVVELLSAHAMSKNFQRGCGSGFSSIPKLLAAYFSIVLKRNTGFSLPSFVSNTKQLLARPDHTATEAKRISKLASAIFDLAEDLINRST